MKHSWDLINILFATKIKYKRRQLVSLRDQMPLVLYLCKKLILAAAARPKLIAFFFYVFACLNILLLPLLGKKGYTDERALSVGLAGLR